ncbi:N-acetyl-D-Glu racemase DgcA [Parasphingopyxis sp.]|uniref:N-acetyl-D-Glu racemase DgcA n=1 Tax=Parasphingopyxis sp. TaxID=1920299 RepID=UPI002613DBDB|nr:N-acetyl-D-Glu racemase DgcA [Parasphingopyxis sp.]
MTRYRTLEVSVEDWPLEQPFTISRGVSHSAEVVVVRLTQDGAEGRGESTPTDHYGESCEGVVAAIEACRDRLEGEEKPSAPGMDLRGAAANAVDCALVDLACKQAGKRAWDILGEPEPGPVQTTKTVPLDTPDKMAADARKWPTYNLLKIKLGMPDGDLGRVAAVRAARPDARLICDANEGWSIDQLRDYVGSLRDAGLEMIEQPLPAGQDDALRDFTSPIPLCADESCHVAADVEALVGKYDLVNIKLDKTGGLRPGLELATAARAHDMKIMVGCMLGTSLAMAPGLLVAQYAKFVDLDGPLALVGDRNPGLSYRDGFVSVPDAALWG